MKFSANSLIRPSFFCTAFLCAAIAGCGTRSNPALERAELNLEAAQKNPELMSRAPTLVNEASVNLEQAQQVWNEDRDRDQVDHLVYLSERKLDIAREEARRKLSLSEADMHRDYARAAAMDLRASTEAAKAQALSSERAALHYRSESEENRRLIQKLRTQVQAIESRETERGLLLTLSGDVLFESSSSQLKPGARTKLGSLSRFLKAHPERSIIVEGHTDSIGSAQYNNDLSQQRADAVRTELIRDGVEASQVTSVGLGKDFPVASNQSEAGRLQNRRVQIVISNS